MKFLVIAVLLSQPGPLRLDGPAGLDKPQLTPSALENARLYFLAGDLVSAREWGERGLKREAKACKPLLKDLAEYSYLVGKWDELTLEEAKQFLVLDHRISPKARGKLTKAVEERFVTGPLARARSWATQGAARDAVQFVENALVVDPKNAEALALKKQLLELADAGLSLDAGR